jgi:hypothetical protein
MADKKINLRELIPGGADNNKEKWKRDPTVYQKHATKSIMAAPFP